VTVVGTGDRLVTQVADGELASVVSEGATERAGTEADSADR
jgi:hypothetical protein